MPFAPLRSTFHLATAAAIVAGGATLAGHGPPRVLTGTFLLAYLGMIAAAVTEPRTRIFADVIDRVPDGLALTFDDGPHPVHTPKVMDALEAGGARGTFFMIARKMAQHPALVREMVARGHGVGAHSYAHDRLFAMRSYKTLCDDADREDDVWDDVLGEVPGLFRPPIGLLNPRIARVAQERDRAIVAWTVRPRDGLARTTPEQVVDRVTAGAREGAIVMLHDAPEGPTDDRAPAALAALPGILEAMARAGLTGRTIPVPAPRTPPDGR